MSYTIKASGTLEGHRNWVTAVVCPQITPENGLKLITASRDKTLVCWKGKSTGTAHDISATADRRLEGHAGFVSDVAISNQADYAVSASWDRSVRLWNLKNGTLVCKCLGHTADVTSVAFSPDNRQIVSGSRDNTIKVWNVKGECMYTFDMDGHSSWVNCVRFAPPTPDNKAYIVSGGADGLVKVWDVTEAKVLHTLQGHVGYVNSVTVSPDGSLCASGGRDGKTKLWDMKEGTHLYELDCGAVINQICFAPNRYWLCAATENGIRLFDLESKLAIAELKPEKPEGSNVLPQCTSLAWSVDGATLYAGFTDNAVHVWTVEE